MSIYSIVDISGVFSFKFNEEWIVLFNVNKLGLILHENICKL